ncbi:prefoldin subunit 4-like [Clytia hemisphaerica]|uniref:Prefoldin subunit 4 n=1 Tax=Clytia hemisphaerica TaxID=252671 RepID=A0A7M5V244_9CNID|eukprot:TCONS_00016569-protein
MTTIPKAKVSDEMKITHEDQKMINAFANKNAKHNELKNTVEKNKKALQNLEDAGDELMMCDDTGSVPVQIGEVFLRMTPDDAQVYIDQQKEEIESEISKCDKQIANYTQELKNLKVKLYAKFGNNINLEEEEES